MRGAGEMMSDILPLDQDKANAQPPTPPIRVLIVDDSATAREAIAAILNSAPGIEIVGQATDGDEGVAMTLQLHPDVITMDINMPRMNGHEATREIMIQCPTPIVVVTTNNQAELVQQGFDLLLAGALEIVQKPSSLSAQTMETIQAELISKVRTVSEIKFPAWHKPSET
jgi:two-component system, chemotaxis family, protein-glutamate methylesterase/glutaminase